MSPLFIVEACAHWCKILISPDPSQNASLGAHTVPIWKRAEKGTYITDGFSKPASHAVYKEECGHLLFLIIPLSQPSPRNQSYHFSSCVILSVSPMAWLNGWNRHPLTSISLWHGRSRFSGSFLENIVLIYFQWHS